MRAGFQRLPSSQLLDFQQWIDIAPFALLVEPVAVSLRRPGFAGGVRAEAAEPEFPEGGFVNVIDLLPGEGAPGDAPGEERQIGVQLAELRQPENPRPEIAPDQRIARLNLARLRRFGFAEIDALTETSIAIEHITAEQEQ